MHPVFSSGNRETIEDKHVRINIKDDNCSFKFKVFTRLNAVKISFTNVSFEHSVFDNCYLRNCVFDSCNFTGCRFIGSNFNQSSLENCSG